MVCSQARAHPSLTRLAPALLFAAGLCAPGALAQTAAWVPGTTFRDCPVCPDMVVIPAGAFTMGSPAGEEGRYDAESPQHRVTIPRALAVGKFEVTRGQFAAFARDTGFGGAGCHVWTGSEWKLDVFRDWRNPGYPQTDEHPVACMNWEWAKAYLAWLAERTGRAYRLLSEAEWEYAARAGTTSARHWGESADSGCPYANIADQTSKAVFGGWALANCADGHVFTAPAGSFKPNAFGLYDMIGNVWEWTEDCWNPDYRGAPADGSAWLSGDCAQRVLRGGSWYGNPRFARSADRLSNAATLRFSYDGFRVARAQ